MAPPSGVGESTISRSRKGLRLRDPRAASLAREPVMSRERREPGILSRFTLHPISAMTPLQYLLDPFSGHSGHLPLTAPFFPRRNAFFRPVYAKICVHCGISASKSSSRLRQPCAGSFPIQTACCLETAYPSMRHIEGYAVCLSPMCLTAARSGKESRDLAPRPIEL